jgi:hypothetical protein
MAISGLQPSIAPFEWANALRCTFPMGYSGANSLVLKTMLDMPTNQLTIPKRRYVVIEYAHALLLHSVWRQLIQINEMCC